MSIHKDEYFGSQIANCLAMVDVKKWKNLEEIVFKYIIVLHFFSLVGGTVDSSKGESKKLIQLSQKRYN